MKTKKALHLVLALLMLLSLAAIMTFSASAAPVGTDLGTWTGTKALTTGSYYLSQNVNGTITVASGNTVTLDLNGFELKYDSTASSAVCVTNNGELKIIDGSEAKTGKISITNTSGNATAIGNGNSGILTVTGGSFYATANADTMQATAIDNYGSCTIEDGKFETFSETFCSFTINNNASMAIKGGEYTAKGSGSQTFNQSNTNAYSKVSGGKFIAEGTDWGDPFNIWDGTAEISGVEVKCSCPGEAWGIYVGSPATAIITSGTFDVVTTGSLSPDHACGIYNLGTATVTGGTFTGTKSYGIYQNGTMTIGGSLDVSDNDVNLYLPTGKTVTLAENIACNVGVTLQSNTGKFTSNGADTDIKYFFSDNKNYGVKYNNSGSGYLELVAVPVDVPTDSVGYYASLTLNENIDINFLMDNFGADFNSSLLSVLVDGAAPASDIVYEEGEISCTLKAVAPSEIGKDLRIVVIYDGVVVKSFDYSVKDYCEAVITAYANAEKTTKEGKLYDLCVAVLNYGKYAEDYHNDMSGYPNKVSTINAGCEINFDDVTITAPTASVTTSTLVTTALSQLVLDSKVNIVFLVKYTGKGFSKDIITIMNDEAEPLAVDPDNITIFPMLGGSYNYAVTIENIGASKLGRSYTLTFDGDETFKLTYGVYNYLKDAQSQTSEEFTDTLKKLCKALYVYGEAAKTYTASLAEAE